MPVIHDPAIRTPERIRTVAALHRLGIVQLLFFIGYILFQFTTAMMLGNLSRFYPFRFFGVLFVASFPLFAGIVAVAAAIMICRQKRQRLDWGSAAAGASIGSILPIVVSVVIAFSDAYGFEDSLYSFYFDTLPRYIVAFYLCVISVLAILALLRCERLRATERRTDKA